MIRTPDKDAGPNNERLYLNSAALGIGRHVSGVADPFNGHIDEFRIVHIQRFDGWIETTWNNMSDPGAFAAAAKSRKAGMASRRRWQAPGSSSA
jgi:hypothetical protein